MGFVDVGGRVGPRFVAPGAQATTDTAADLVTVSAAPDDARRYRLAKAVGVLAVTASAVAQEYGSGINFVSVQSLSVYPGVHGYVPLAMLLTGLALLPKAYHLCGVLR